MIPQDAPRVSGRFPADLIRDMVRWWPLQFRFGGRAQHLDEMVLTFVSRAYAVVPSAVRCLLDVPLTPGGPREVPRGGAGAHQIRRWVWGATTIPKQIIMNLQKCPAQLPFSWLRARPGPRDPRSSCRTQARKLLHMARDLLNLPGAPGQSGSGSIFVCFPAKLVRPSSICTGVRNSRTGPGSSRTSAL